MTTKHPAQKRYPPEKSLVRRAPIFALGRRPRQGTLGLIWNDDADDANGRPYDVVIDGRTLSWEELGHALESYNGWRFRIVIEDSIDDARTDAEIIALPPEDHGV